MMILNTLHVVTRIETRWLRRAHKDFHAMFPYPPGQSGYNKRLRKLAGTIAWLTGELGQLTSIDGDDVWIVDSTPVECGRSRDRETLRPGRLVSNHHRRHGLQRPRPRSASNNTGSTSSGPPAKERNPKLEADSSKHCGRSSNPSTTPSKANSTSNHGEAA